MPQSSDHLRRKMIRYFGDIGDEHPRKYLTEAGYELQAGWTWKAKPGVNELGDMTMKEFECLAFLIEEWDFGGLDV